MELLIVLAIASTIASMTIPALRDTLIRARLTTTSNALAHGLYLARQTAITQQRHTTLCAGNLALGCTGDWNSGTWIAFIDRNHSGQPQDAADVLLRGTPHQDVKIYGNGPFRTAVVFSPIGISQLPSGAFGAGRLRICAATSHALPAIELVLSATGRVRVEHVDLGGECPRL